MALSYALNLLAKYSKGLVPEGNERPQEMDDSLKYFAMNLLLYNLVKLNYTAFLQKAKVPAYRSMGGTDQYGNHWKALSPKTIALKKKLGYKYAGSIAINIRTRRLLESLKPGYFRNGVYFPRNADQSVSVTLDEAHFETKVPYAEYVDEARPIYALNSAMLFEAMQRSAPVIENYWNRREVKRRVNARKRFERMRQDVNTRKKLRDVPPPGPPASLE